MLTLSGVLALGKMEQDKFGVLMPILAIMSTVAIRGVSHRPSKHVMKYAMNHIDNVRMANVFVR